MKMFVYGMRIYDELPNFEKYAKKYDIDFEYTEEYPSPENYHLTKGFDAISIITNTVDAQMIETLKENGVKVISTRTIGYEHIDVDAARKAGLGVCNVTYVPSAVADYTIMLILIASRGLPFIMQQAEAQNFTLRGKIGRDLFHCTVGVIGTGRIGTALIERLKEFGCRILAYDLYPKDSVKEMADYTDLQTIYRESDIITLHAPASESTYHMLNNSTFSMMKDGVMIINCARGSLIDTEDLITNLTSGKVGFAALDVIERETGIYYKDLSGRNIDNREMAVLKSFSNVFFSPHMAFYTEEAVANMVEGSIQGALAYLNGEEYPYIVC